MVTIPIHKARPEEISIVLIEYMFSKYSMPEYIIMDKDSVFMSLLINYLLKNLGSKIMTVTPFNHQSS